MDDFRYMLPFQQYSSSRNSLEVHPEDAAHTLEDDWLPRDPVSSQLYSSIEAPPYSSYGAQLHPLYTSLYSSHDTPLHSSHATDAYPSLPIGAERTRKTHSFPQDLSSFPSTDDFPTADPLNLEQVDSDGQSEADDDESDPEIMSSDSESVLEDDTLPLLADAARWISMPPTQFDREYPGGNPFVIQELNMDWEESESASYGELNAASALKRITVIFCAVEEALFSWVQVRNIHRDITWGVLADLCKDGKIWLWIEGDEEKCARLPWKASRSKESLEYVEQKLSCSLLQRRIPSTVSWIDCWQRVSRATFVTRLSVIIWAAYTSVSVREAGWVRGLADWTRCGVARAISRWTQWVVSGNQSVRILGDEEKHSHFKVVFQDALRHHGHSCYPLSDRDSLKRWLGFQSFLVPRPSSRYNVSMILLLDPQLAWHSNCRRCGKLYIYFLSRDIPIDLQVCTLRLKLYAGTYNTEYVGPSLSLVFLNEWRVRFDIDMKAWLRILVLGVSRGIISDATLTRIDDRIRTEHNFRSSQADFDHQFDFEFQPWVNRLPRYLRELVSTCSAPQWREVERAVGMEKQHKSGYTSPLSSTDVGLGVLLTAIFLFFMSEHRSQILTPRKYQRHCSLLKDRIDGVFDNPVYPTHISAAVEAFCDATSESSDVSTHTCCEFRWDTLKLEFRQCYAAAYLLLHPECAFVPFLEPLSRPTERYYGCVEDCFRRCIRCQELPAAEPLATPADKVLQLPTSGVGSVSLDSLLYLHRLNEERDDIMSNTFALADLPNKHDMVPRALVAPFSESQVETHILLAALGGLNTSQRTSEIGRLRASALSKDVILPKVKDHFMRLLAQYNIPLQYSNLGGPQLPWHTLPQLLSRHGLEIAGWPQDLPLPDSTGKHNAKGIMGLTAKDARRLYAALDGISFRRAGTRPREEESEDDIRFRPMKKARGKGKAQAEGEKKFRLSDVQTVIRGIRVEKFDLSYDTPTPQSSARIQ